MAFTYLIGWSGANKWYIGSRWAEGCAPSDLWKSYFTSSKYVRAFRKKHGEPDIIEVGRVFESKKAAIEHEAFLLKINRAKERECFLNKSDGCVFDPADPEIRERIREALTGKKLSNWHRERIALGKIGNANRKGTVTSEQGRRNIGRAKLGTRHSDETKRKMSQTRAGRKFSLVECPHCGKIGGESAMKQWHFNHCKFLKEK